MKVIQHHNYCEIAWLQISIPVEWIHSPDTFVVLYTHDTAEKYITSVSYLFQTYKVVKFDWYLSCLITAINQDAQYI